MKVRPPRGMKDILPKEAFERDLLITKLSSTYRKWGFSLIECPTMENIDRLIGSQGGENEKMLFHVLRRGLDFSDIADSEYFSYGDISDLGLRYDLTVPLARYIATNQESLPKYFKCYQYGPVWRAERPQKGRFRQFTQWDADIVGIPEGLPEIELVLCGSEALLDLGVKDFDVKFNDRRILSLFADSLDIPTNQHVDLFISIDKLDKIGIGGVINEITRKGILSQIKSAKLADVLTRFNKSSGMSLREGINMLEVEIPSELIQKINFIFETIKKNAINFTISFDLTLARGMGYYTGSIFEVVHKDFTSSIAGGGRYDSMIERFSGKSLPACGFSLGFDRILSSSKTVMGEKIKSFAVLAETTDFENALIYCQNIRKMGMQVSLFPKQKNTRQQLHKLKEIGFTHFKIYWRDSESEDFNEL